MSPSILRVFRNQCLQTIQRFGKQGNRLFFGVRTILRSKKGLKIISPGIAVSNDTVLIDQKSDRHRGHSEVIVGIRKDRPGHLLPLHEKNSPVGMLFLADSGDREFAVGH